MDKGKGKDHKPNGGHGERGHNQSSLWMHEPDGIFSALELERGDRFLDLGCGPGDYAVHASSIVGDSGLVYALDKRENMVAGIIKCFSN